MSDFTLMTSAEYVKADEHGNTTIALLVNADYEEDGCIVDGEDVTITVRPHIEAAGAHVSTEELTRACNKAFKGKDWKIGLRHLRRTVNEVINTEGILNALRAIDATSPDTPAPPAAEHQVPPEKTAPAKSTDNARMRQGDGMAYLIPDPQTFAGMLLCAEDTRAYLGRLDVKAFSELRRHPDFPAPVMLTPRRLAWRVCDLDAFISTRMQRK